MDSFRMICSAPNWFQSSLCDSSSKGVVAIGTHHRITLLWVTPSSPSMLSHPLISHEPNHQYKPSTFSVAKTKNDHLFLGELLGHRDRVQCCKFAFFSSKLLAPNSSISSTNTPIIELLISASSDCSIRIWNIESKQCLIILKPPFHPSPSTKHSDHHIADCHHHPITALSVTNNQMTTKRSLTTDTLIISGDSKGFVLCWNPLTNQRTMKRVSDTTVMALEVCPYHIDQSTECDDIQSVAIGYKSGIVLLLGVNARTQITELRRFRGHDADIQSMSWCQNYLPLDSLQFEPDSNSDSNSSKTVMDWLPAIFVTASRDRLLRFWSTQSGECVLEIQIEAKRDHNNRQSGQQRNWYTVRWLLPSTLFVTGSNGKIQSVNLSHFVIDSIHTMAQREAFCLTKNNKNKSNSLLPKDAVRAFEEVHSRSIFSVVAIKNRPRHLLTVSLDRNIVYWDRTTLKSLWTMRCLGGYVYDLDIAPWDASLLAMAVGDKMIRIWTVPDSETTNKLNELQNGDTAKYKLNPLLDLDPFGDDQCSEHRTGKTSKSKKVQQRKDPYHCKVLWRGLKDKITAIKWHPTDIGWCAYGTDKGGVGCLDVNSESGGHVRLLTYHESMVVKVEWKVIAMEYRSDYIEYKHDQQKSSSESITNGTMDLDLGFNENNDTFNVSTKKKRSKKNKNRNKKGKKQKTANMESGFRVYSLSRDGTIYEGDGWRPNVPSKNINDHIVSANECGDILRTSSQERVMWTCFSVEVIDPYDAEKYKNLVHGLKDQKIRNIENGQNQNHDGNHQNHCGQKMVIGSGNGLIYVLNGDWKLLCSMHDYNSLIRCIELNPFRNIETSFFNQNGHILRDSKGSCSEWIAAGTVDGYILFYEMTPNSKEDHTWNHRMVDKVRHSAKGKAVTKLKWHPFDPNVIVSISNDKRHPLFVWHLSRSSNAVNAVRAIKIFRIESDIAKNEQSESSSFMTHHHARYLSVEWSHRSPFVMYTGSEDQTCRRLDILNTKSGNKTIAKHSESTTMRMSEMKPVVFQCAMHSQPITITVKKSKFNDRKSGKMVSELSSNLSVSSLSNKSKSKMTGNVKSPSKQQRIFTSFGAQKMDHSMDSLWKLIRYYYTLSLTQDNRTDTEWIEEMKFDPLDTLLLRTKDIPKNQITEWITSILPNQQSGLYPMELLSSFKYQMQHLMTNDGTSIVEQQLNTFNTNSSETPSSSKSAISASSAKQAKSRKPVPTLPCLLSLLVSPTLGRQKWIDSMLNLCEYFKHPKVALYHNAAAIYLSLASPQFVHHCIEMYCDIGYYIEALLVARYHLVDTHPVIERVLCLFGESLLSKKNYTAAIKCYIATLSIYSESRERGKYGMRLMEVIKKWIFGTFKAHFYDKVFGTEWIRWKEMKPIKSSKSSDPKKKSKRRRIGKTELLPLRLLFDTIHLMTQQNCDDDDDDDDDALKWNALKCTDEIVVVHSLLTLCNGTNHQSLYLMVNSMKRKMKMQCIPLLVQFTMSISDGKAVDVLSGDEHKEEFDFEGMAMEYKRLEIDERIDFILGHYQWTRDSKQWRLSSAMIFGNLLFRCFVCYGQSDWEQFESVFWECLNCGLTYNSLLILQHFMFSLKAMMMDKLAVDLQRAIALILETFGMVMKEERDSNHLVEIERMTREYGAVINRYGSSNQRLECELMVKCLQIMVIAANSDSVVERVLHETESWQFIGKALRDVNVCGVEGLKRKCRIGIDVSSGRSDPYVKRVRSLLVATTCVADLLNRFEAL